MKKYYEEKKYNLAFERCVSIMSRLIQKNGRDILTGIAIENILKMTTKTEQTKPDPKVTARRYKSYLNGYMGIMRKRD